MNIHKFLHLRVANHMGLSKKIVSAPFYVLSIPKKATKNFVLAMCLFKVSTITCCSRRFYFFTDYLKWDWFCIIFIYQTKRRYKVNFILHLLHSNFSQIYWFVGYEMLNLSNQEKGGKFQINVRIFRSLIIDNTYFENIYVLDSRKIRF